MANDKQAVSDKELQKRAVKLARRLGFDWKSPLSVACEIAIFRELVAVRDQEVADD